MKRPSSARPPSVIRRRFDVLGRMTTRPPIAAAGSSTAARAMARSRSARTAPALGTMSEARTTATLRRSACRRVRSMSRTVPSTSALINRSATQPPPAARQATKWAIRTRGSPGLGARGARADNRAAKSMSTAEATACQVEIGNLSAHPAFHPADKRLRDTYRRGDVNLSLARASLADEAPPQAHRQAHGQAHPRGWPPCRAGPSSSHSGRGFCTRTYPAPRDVQGEARARHPCRHATRAYPPRPGAHA